MKWSKRQMKIVGKLKYVASDDRARVMKDDHIEWLETKLKEINRLAQMLPSIPLKKSKRAAGSSGE